MSPRLKRSILLIVGVALLAGLLKWVAIAYKIEWLNHLPLGAFGVVLAISFLLWQGRTNPKE